MAVVEKEVVTVMILYVDLKCSSCYKKLKKLLCKFPQIRDQVFDEDKNKVMITVVCCNPEKLRDKLCCKGGKVIQSIEIVENPPPKQPQKPKEIQKPKQPPPPVPVPVPAVPVPVPAVPVSVSVPVPVAVHEKPKPKEPEKPKEIEKSKPPPVVLLPTPKPDPPPKPQPDPMPPQPQPEPVMPMPMPDPMHGYPHPPPVSVCCQECYEGRSGGPCHYGYGRPPQGPSYDSNYGYQYRPCYVTRCDYFSEDNPQGCSIM